MKSSSEPPTEALFCCGEFETSRLTFSSEIKHFDPDRKFRARFIYNVCWSLGPLGIGRGTEQVKKGQVNPDHLSDTFLSWEFSWGVMEEVRRGKINPRGGGEKRENQPSWVLSWRLSWRPSWALSWAHSWTHSCGHSWTHSWVTFRCRLLCTSPSQKTLIRGIRDGGLNIQRTSEEKCLFPPFSGFPTTSWHPPEKGEKGSKRAKKADFGRCPGREGRHPLSPHFLHPPINSD